MVLSVFLIQNTIGFIFKAESESLRLLIIKTFNPLTYFTIVDMLDLTFAILFYASGYFCVFIFSVFNFTDYTLF